MTTYFTASITPEGVGRLLAAAYLHLIPVMAWASFCGVYTREIRETYEALLVRRTMRLSVFLRVASVVLLLWLPFIMIAIYVAFFDPYRVYDFEAPSLAVSTACLAVGFFLYGAVMGVVVYFVYVRKPPPEKDRRPRAFAAYLLCIP